MDRKTDKLVSAIGDIDTAYLEEALDFNRTNADRRKRTRFPKLSAACAAVLIILGVSVTAFAISRIPLSWRDIFSPGQTVIGEHTVVGGNAFLTSSVADNTHVVIHAPEMVFKNA